MRMAMFRSRQVDIAFAHFMPGAHHLVLTARCSLPGVDLNSFTDGMAAIYLRRTMICVFYRAASCQRRSKRS